MGIFLFPRVFFIIVSKYINASPVTFFVFRILRKSIFLTRDAWLYEENSFRILSIFWMIPLKKVMVSSGFSMMLKHSGTISSSFSPSNFCFIIIFDFCAFFFFCFDLYRRWKFLSSLFFFHSRYLMSLVWITHHHFPYSCIYHNTFSLVLKR